jgi:hypothetical protein
MMPSSQAERIFGGLKPVGATVEPARWRRRRAARGQGSGAGAFRAGFEGPGYRDDDVYAAQVYATAMGGGMSSACSRRSARNGACAIRSMRIGGL